MLNAALAYTGYIISPPPPSPNCPPTTLPTIVFSIDVKGVGGGGFKPRCGNAGLKVLTPHHPHKQQASNHS